MLPCLPSQLSLFVVVGTFFTKKKYIYIIIIIIIRKDTAATKLGLDDSRVESSTYGSKKMKNETKKLAGPSRMAYLLSLIFVFEIRNLFKKNLFFLLQ